MCSQSVSGSSLLSGYNEDDVRERSGRSRREFEEIDAVLYDEEKSKRATIKKICEEWSSKPHFRIRGRLFSIERQPSINFPQSFRPLEIAGAESTAPSSTDLLTNTGKTSNLNSNELNVLLNENASGRSSIDSIEGSELTNNSDLDEEATNTALNEQLTDPTVDSFDTDEDDDDDDEEHDDFSSGITHRDRSKHRHHHGHSKQPQLLIKCMKDSIVNSLASLLFRQLIAEQQPTFQRYTKSICERNAIKLRPKLRPYSLPPRSLSQNRYSLPSGTSITATGALLQITSFPFRSTPEPDMKLTGLLRVTPIRITNAGAITNVPTSPRKSQAQMALPPPPPPPPPLGIVAERTTTSLLVEKRNQQQISLIGTAVSNLPPQLTLVTAQSSQNVTRQTSSTWRYRSATSTTNTNIQSTEPNTRLPPINIERIASTDQLPMNRSNMITSAIVESVPPATRAVSGTSTGSNLSSTVKLRTLASMGKVQKPARPITISSINTTKDLIHSSSTSPARSITATITPSSIIRTTPGNRTQQQQQQHQKRPVLTTKAPPPPPPSTIIKISAPHIY